MPIDTVKTIMQVEGAQGITMLRAKVAKGGIRVFYSGALAASGATFAGHFPWFFTHNLLVRGCCFRTASAAPAATCAATTSSCLCHTTLWNFTPPFPVPMLTAIAAAVAAWRFRRFVVSLVSEREVA